MYEYNCPDCNETKLQTDKNARKINEVIDQVNALIQVNNETVDFIEEKANEVVSEVAEREVNEVLGDLRTEIDNISSSLDNMAIQLDEFIVNGESDYTNAFNRANAMLSNGGTILLSCKEYNYSDIITLNNNVSLMCLNGYATLKALNLQKSCIKFGNNSRLENLILSSETTTRDSLDTSTKLHTNNADNVRIKNIIIDGANSAGMLFINMSNFVIENCIVRNTKADGIHITNGCKNGIVQNNFVYNVGDDGVACVSYQNKGEQVENIKVINNTVDTTNARGISNIGSRNILIKNNTVKTNRGANIIVGYEYSYNTFKPSNTVIENNTLSNFGIGLDHPSILLTEIGDNDKIGTIIRGNIIDGSTMINKKNGIKIDYCSNVTIIENNINNVNVSVMVGNFVNPSNGFRPKNIKILNNKVIECKAPVLSNIDFLQCDNNHFIKTSIDSDRHLFVASAKFSSINNNIVTNTEDGLGIIKFENLYQSIVGYNIANVSYGFTSETNPYTNSYEWDNKIMEGQGVTIPLFNPSGGHRCGKFGTMAVSTDGTSLKVRVGQNEWKTIEMK